MLCVDAGVFKSRERLEVDENIPQLLLFLNMVNCKLIGVSRVGLDWLGKK